MFISTVSMTNIICVEITIAKHCNEKLYASAW